jgi:hypothetical protein
VLLLAERAAPHALPDVRPEVLSEAVATVLQRARTSLDAAARAELATDLGATPAELDRFTDSLVEDGVLVNILER